MTCHIVCWRASKCKCALFYFKLRTFLKTFIVNLTFDFLKVMEHAVIISNYYHMRLAYKDIQLMLSLHHGVDLSLRHLKRVLRALNLGRRSSYLNLTEVIKFVSDELEHSGMLHGYRWMYEKCLDSGLKVRREAVRVVLQCLDPTAVAIRRARRLHRRAYFARGPNYIWHIDSYDKLKYFGFCINGCIDGFSRRMIWLCAYFTSSDPKLIGGYFIDAVKEIDCCPKLVRTDDGTENVIVLKLQRFLRRHGTDAFAADKSALTGASTHNQRIECWWGMLRKQCIEFWLVLLHDLKNAGDFDGRHIDRNVLQFCLMGVIQVGEIIFLPLMIIYISLSLV